MSSSTSSSSRRARERGALGLFAVAFLLLAAGTAAGWRLSPLRDRLVLAAAEHAAPADDEYLAYSGGTIDHHVVFHGLEGGKTRAVVTYVGWDRKGRKATRCQIRVALRFAVRAAQQE